VRTDVGMETSLKVAALLLIGFVLGWVLRGL
jgi:hypothetical protein